MKLILSSLFLLWVSACSYGENKQVAIPSPLENISVEQEIASATASKDFRLYATSGRRVTIPGLEGSEFTSLKARCGYKFIANTGDVITSEAQRKHRTQSVDYMKKYNTLMKEVCLQQSLTK